MLRRESTLSFREKLRYRHLEQRLRVAGASTPFQEAGLRSSVVWHKGKDASDVSFMRSLLKSCSLLCLDSDDVQLGGEL
jgi:hypothetical protein